MKKPRKINIFLVDDDAVYLKLLSIDFSHNPGYTVNTFPTGEACLEALHLKPDVVILDYHLDGIDKHAMNGIQILDKINELQKAIPVIMLSAQDNIEIAVNCMHHHAHDYVVKSETAFMRLEKIIGNTFQFKKIEKELSWYMERM